MNPIKKIRSPDPLPRVRKRNSIRNKPASNNTVDATQRRASLLKNNRNLALTLQETRCELAVYKDFFEQSQDYINKAKLAKSRMVQLSASLKNFLKTFDENILLLDFDDLKCPNVKASSQSNKSFQLGMNPVIEACDEILEEGSCDQEMNCNKQNNPEYSDQMDQNPSDTFQKASDKEKCYDPKIVSKSPPKKSEGFVDKGLKHHSETRDAEGNEDIAREASNAPKKHPNSLQNPLSAPVSSQAIRTTKIPVCQPLSIKLKKQNFVKESKPPNKPSKRKSFDKKYEESDPNYSRRKTFVVKSSNVLTKSVSVRNATDENEHCFKEKLNVPENELASKNDKRKTFVLKSSNILKEPEPVIYLNKVDKELVTENRGHVNETSNMQDVLTLEKNKRKTFVMKNNDKTVLHQNNNIAQHQIPFPIKECTVNLEVVGNSRNNDQDKSIQSSSDFDHSEALPDFEVVKSKQTCAENSEKIECNADISPLNMNVSATEVIENDKISATDVSKASDTADKVGSDQIIIQATEKDIDIMNEALIFDDRSQKDEDTNKVPECSPIKKHKSFLDSSESEMNLIIDCELDYDDKQPAFKTTPIRRKISKSKKKKFVFDSNKQNFETGNNHSQRNVEASHSDVVSNNENDVNEMRVRDGVSVSDENPVNTLSEIGSVQQKTTKTSSKRIKSSQRTSNKKNRENNSTKLKKVKNKEINECAVELDDLILQPKKIKKKNIKKKKTVNFEDDNVISKFVEVNKVTKFNKIKKTQTEQESDFSCKKTGKHTFLVRAEIHPPPPSFSMPDIKEINKEDDNLNLQHMQVAVVLNDVLKSKNVELLNISNRDVLCSKADSIKSSLSGSSNSFVIDPEESIEKLRCDPVAEADDCDLHSDAILGIGHSEAHNDPVYETENPKGRRRKPISYKEPSLSRKLRRC